MKSFKIKLFCILFLVFLNGINFTSSTFAVIKLFNTNALNYGFDNKSTIDAFATLVTDNPFDQTNSTNNVDITKNDQPKDFVKWVDFNVSTPLLKRLYQLSKEYYGSDIDFDFCKALSYLSVKNGNKFNFKTDSRNLNILLDKLNSGQTMQQIVSGKYYDYFLDCYSAIFKEFFGEYTIGNAKSNFNAKSDSSISIKNDKNANAEDDSFFDKLKNKSYNGLNDKNDSPTTPQIKKEYGLKAYFPFADGYWLSHYDDFGNSRSFGFKRKHLGHDMFGSVDTPIIAIEGGTIKELGWNRYGGWRIGILSFDGKRYYYYAHLRKNHPYVKSLVQGQAVEAGQVIGYLGMTGYSNTQNTNLKTGKPHLHLGLQLIFDESQVKGNKEIWIDLYSLTNFLCANKAKVVKDNQTNEYNSINLKKSI